MKKFSSLNQTNRIISEPDSRIEIIKNIIRESITINNGKIVGAEQLSETIDKMFQINECKTTINTLEQVKIMSRHNFSFQMINESIELQKNRIESIINGQYEIIEEAKKCDNEDCKTNNEEDLDMDGEEDMDGEDCVGKNNNDKYNKKIKKYQDNDEGDDIPDEETEIVEKHKNDVFVTSYDEPLKDIYNLRNIISKINEEHHLSSKEDRIEFIMKNLEIRGVKDIVFNFIKNSPIYVETTDIRETLMDLDDEQIEQIYLKVEEVPSVLIGLDEKVQKILEHHLDKREDRIDFILDSLGDELAKEKIIEYLSNVPNYIKTSDIENTINQLSDAEIEELYLGVEEVLY